MNNIKRTIISMLICGICTQALGGVWKVYNGLPQEAAVTMTAGLGSLTQIAVVKPGDYIHFDFGGECMSGFAVQPVGKSKVTIAQLKGMPGTTFTKVIESLAKIVIDVARESWTGLVSDILKWIVLGIEIAFYECPSGEFLIAQDKQGNIAALKKQDS